MYKMHIMILVISSIIYSGCASTDFDKNAHRTKYSTHRPSYTDKLSDYGMIGVGPGGPGHGY
jgi:hypothetical protein